MDGLSVLCEAVSLVNNFYYMIATALILNRCKCFHFVSSSEVCVKIQLVFKLRVPGSTVIEKVISNRLEYGRTVSESAIYGCTVS